MFRRPVVLAGVTVAGAAGYYLYTAGGDPKVAEKKAKSDAASASAAIKSRLPGSGEDAKAHAKLSAEQAGRKIDDAFVQAKDQAEGYRAGAADKLGEIRKETGAKLSGAVDKFDQSVEKGASKSKSWISGWFGGK